MLWSLLQVNYSRLHSSWRDSKLDLLPGNLPSLLNEGLACTILYRKQSILKVWHWLGSLSSEAAITTHGHCTKHSFFLSHSPSHRTKAPRKNQSIMRPKLFPSKCNYIHMYFHTYFHKKYISSITSTNYLLN